MSELVKVEVTELEEKPQPTHALVAVNATEMSLAKDSLNAFLVNKLRELDEQCGEYQAALDEAIKNKWKTSTFRSIVHRTNRRILYYSKLLAACQAGYTIVPNMDVDVIAIRVRSEDTWYTDYGESTLGIRSASPSIPEAKEDRLAAGEGTYQAPEYETLTTTSTRKNEKGEVVYQVTHRASSYEDIDFPVAIAHPVVMSAVSAAMQMKIFDRIGVVPRTGRALRGDPIVLGQITRKEGNETKVASFLIAWYLDPKTL